MKTTAVVLNRGGGKGYLCPRHKLCFPNSAAANEEFLQSQFFYSPSSSYK